jgi:predicted hydrocarbon binding protein
MFDVGELGSRFALRYDPATYRRHIADKEVILHCHHYNSRLQHTIEGATAVDGRAIIVRAAEATFAQQIANAIEPTDDAATRLRVARNLYAHLGYGWLDFSEVDEGTVSASASHFVEGWNAGFPGRSTPVCSFTEGYLQGAIHAALGRLVRVEERACMINGAKACQFAVLDRDEPLATHSKSAVRFSPKPEPAGPRTNVDADKIVQALVEMPIHGNSEGLIPAFGVYLASTPADYYNRICLDFVAAMGEAGLASTAQKLLVYDAETCGMNTFRGIMSSPEWDGLVGPMIREPSDNLFGIVAVSNALGWGNWHVTQHDSPASAKLESLNGYEALGCLEHRGPAKAPQCYMLTGVAAGIMELVYGTGTLEERFGTYSASEETCICCDAASCTFEVERV